MTALRKKYERLNKFIVEIAHQELQAERIVLFGSAARNQLSSGSDIDLCVVADNYVCLYGKLLGNR